MKTSEGTLPIKKILIDAYTYPFLDAPTLLRLAAIPLCLFYLSGFIFGFVGRFAERYPFVFSEDPDQLKIPLIILSTSVLMIQWFFTAVFAVTWHRFVLLDPSKFKVRTNIGISITSRELFFFLYSAAYYLILMGPHIFAKSGLAGQLLLGSQHAFNNFIAALLLWPVFMIPFVPRLVLVLPAAAIERRISFLQSWKMTKGQALRVVAVVLLCGLPLPILNQLVFGPLYEGAQGGLSLIIIEFAWILLVFLQTAIATTGVSLSYRWLMLRNKPAAKGQEPATAG